MTSTKVEPGDRTSELNQHFLISRALCGLRPYTRRVALFTVCGEGFPVSKQHHNQGFYSGGPRWNWVLASFFPWLFHLCRNNPALFEFLHSKGYITSFPVPGLLTRAAYVLLFLPPASDWDISAFKVARQWCSYSITCCITCNSSSPHAFTNREKGNRDRMKEFLKIECWVCEKC